MNVRKYPYGIWRADVAAGAGSLANRVEKKQKQITWKILEKHIRDKKEKNIYSASGLSCALELDGHQNAWQLANSDTIKMTFFRMKTKKKKKETKKKKIHAFIFANSIFSLLSVSLDRTAHQLTVATFIIFNLE